MSQRKFIQKAIALFLLLAVTLSNTPQTFLHSAVADHNDVFITCEHSKPCVHQQDVNCHLDNLVVNTIYTTAIETPGLLSLNVCESRYNATYTSIYKPSWFTCKDYRGPPSLA